MGRTNDHTHRSGVSPQLVIILVLAVLLVIFTLQNQEKVSIRLFFWTIGEIPVALLLIISLLAGYLIPFFTLLFRRRNPVGKGSEYGDMPEDDGDRFGPEDQEDEGDEEAEDRDEDSPSGEESSSRRSIPRRPDPEGVPFDDEETPGKRESSITRKFFRE